jgi:subtilisin family serine protease
MNRFSLPRIPLRVLGILLIATGVLPGVLPGASARDGSASTDGQTWIIRLEEGAQAREVAAQLGALYSGPLRGVEGYHRIRFLENLENRSGEPLERVIARQLESTPAVEVFEQEETLERYPRSFAPADPRFSEQWHLENAGQSGGLPFADIRVRPVWDAGISGAGVTIAIVDEGTQYRHPDLEPNWVIGSGYDYNDDDSDPSPSGSDDRHGTAVAGISLAASNRVGGLGVAYDSRLVPLRLIAGPYQSG